MGGGDYKERESVYKERGRDEGRQAIRKRRRC